jgi:predicted RNA binding protein YcfA (HicA-like mRNA interferase family)
MPAFGPVSRRQLIEILRRLGWSGPFVGTGPHLEYMTRGTRRLRLPNPHRGDIGVALLRDILRQAGITREEWECS